MCCITKYLPSPSGRSDHWREVPSLAEKSREAQHFQLIPAWALMASSALMDSSFSCCNVVLVVMTLGQVRSHVSTTPLVSNGDTKDGIRGEEYLRNCRGKASKSGLLADTMADKIQSRQQSDALGDENSHSLTYKP